MSNLLDPDTSIKEISDELLISEFLNPSKYKKLNLYALMAKRSSHNKEILDLLFSIIKDKKYREQSMMGRIMHSWLPAVFILEHSDENNWKGLKQVLFDYWNKEEKEEFLDYIKQDENYYNFLKDIKKK